MTHNYLTPLHRIVQTGWWSCLLSTQELTSALFSEPWLLSTGLSFPWGKLFTVYRPWRPSLNPIGQTPAQAAGDQPPSLLRAYVTSTFWNVFAFTECLPCDPGWLHSPHSGLLTLTTAPYPNLQTQNSSCVRLADLSHVISDWVGIWVWKFSCKTCVLSSLVSAWKVEKSNSFPSSFLLLESIFIYQYHLDSSCIAVQGTQTLVVLQ